MSNDFVKELEDLISSFGVEIRDDWCIGMTIKMSLNTDANLRLRMAEGEMVLIWECQKYIDPIMSMRYKTLFSNQ